MQIDGADQLQPLLICEGNFPSICIVCQQDIAVHIEQTQTHTHRQTETYTDKQQRHELGWNFKCLRRHCNCKLQWHVRPEVFALCHCQFATFCCRFASFASLQILHLPFQWPLGIIKSNAQANKIVMRAQHKQNGNCLVAKETIEITKKNKLEFKCEYFYCKTEPNAVGYLYVRHF